MGGRNRDGRRDRRPGGRPDGVPLGRAFLIGPGLANEPLREAIDVVARVHGDGDLPTIPVVWDTSLEVRARFVIRDGLPSVIAVRPGTALVVPIIHEIGHYLDFSAIDGLGAFASSASTHLDAWKAVVTRTPTYQALTAVVASAIADPVFAAQIGHSRLAALTTADELWARSYTQYVGSGSV